MKTTRTCTNKVLHDGGIVTFFGREDECPACKAKRAQLRDLIKGKFRPGLIIDHLDLERLISAVYGVRHEFDPGYDENLYNNGGAMIWGYDGNEDDSDLYPYSCREDLRARMRSGESVRTEKVFMMMVMDEILPPGIYVIHTIW